MADRLGDKSYRGLLSPKEVSKKNFMAIQKFLDSESPKNQSLQRTTTRQKKHQPIQVTQTKQNHGSLENLNSPANHNGNTTNRHKLKKTNESAFGLLMGSAGEHSEKRRSKSHRAKSRRSKEK